MEAPKGPEARILIVEDDREIAELVAAYLLREGKDPHIVGSAEDALRFCEAGIPDLVVLDLGLPGADGLDFLKNLRQKSTAPVIIVSARESDEDKVLGLGLGADDFVSKPFSPRVLVARVEAQLRRASYGHGGPEDSRDRYDFGPYILDMSAKLLDKEGERVPLSRREFELLSFLVINESKTYSPQELYRSVWGLEHGDLSTVAVHVQRIRRKIEEDSANPRWLLTVPGAGYRFLSGKTSHAASSREGDR